MAFQTERSTKFLWRFVRILMTRESARSNLFCFDVFFLNFNLNSPKMKCHVYKNTRRCWIPNWFLRRHWITVDYSESLHDKQGWYGIILRVVSIIRIGFPYLQFFLFFCEFRMRTFSPGVPQLALEQILSTILHSLILCPSLHSAHYLITVPKISVFFSFVKLRFP